MSRSPAAVYKRALRLGVPLRPVEPGHARFGGVIMNKSALATAGFGGAAGIVLFIVVEPLLAPDGAKSHHKKSGERHRLVKT